MEWATIGPQHGTQPLRCADATVHGTDRRGAGARGSVHVIDNRDDRMVSPFQTWLVSEIMANAASSINVLTERDQVMPPNSGFHLALFGNYTLDGIKVVIAISIESNTGNTSAGWDAETAQALAHPAFQPFSWPMLRDTSASYVDLKIYNGNEILFHCMDLQRLPFGH